MWMPEDKVGPYEVVSCLSREESLCPVYLVTHDDRPGVQETLFVPYQPEGFRADVLAEEAWHWKSVFDDDHLVAIKEIQIQQGRLAVFSPFYPEGSLERRRLSADGLSVEQVCAGVCQALLGLERLHAAGIIHQRFHPRNLLRDGDKVRLTGASFAPFLYPLTEPIENLLEDRYVAPEEYEGHAAHVGSDLWAVGKTLEALLLRRSALDTTLVPTPLRAIIEKCLDPDPLQRWASAQQLHEALTQLGQKPDDKPTDKILQTSQAISTTTDSPENPVARRRSPAFPESLEAELIREDATSASPKSSRGSGQKRSGLLTGVATVVVLGLFGLGWWLSRRPKAPSVPPTLPTETRPSPVPEATPTPAPPTATPPPASPELARGMLLREQGNIPEALVAFQAATVSTPDDPDAWYWRGQCALALRKRTEALDSFNRAVGLRPTVGEYYGARATAYEQAGELRKAIQDYRTASRLEPNNESHIKNLNRALTKEKRS